MNADNPQTSPQPESSADPGVARTIARVPFISGSTWAPQINKSKDYQYVFRDQVVPGQTHLEVYMSWRLLEPEKDRWNFADFDQLTALSQARSIKIEVFPWTQYAPKWFVDSADYVPLRELGTGKTVDMLSPWAPGSLAAIDHFYAGLKAHAGDRIDIISIGSPCSDYGEIGLVIGAPNFLPGQHLYDFFPQDPKNWHVGYWCGDPYALPNFRNWALARYGGLDPLNAAWGTAYPKAADIAFPDHASREAHRRHWIDFMTWYEESQTTFSVEFVKAVRKYFPETHLETKLGFGSDDPRPGLDRTGVIKAMADFKPFTIRSTHGAYNREKYQKAYWFYKRMAPLTHDLDMGFGCETPGGDLTEKELLREMFEDASAGVNYVFQYFQNFHTRPDAIDTYKRVLRPQERSLVDIAVLYPTAHLLLNVADFPEDQLAFCSLGREFLDYDVLDQNLIDWGKLANYRVLIQTGDRYVEKSNLEKIDQWVRAGGLFVAREGRPLETVEGDGAIAKAWIEPAGPAGAAVEPAAAGAPAPGGKGTLYKVGRGCVVVLPGATVEEYLATVVGLLKLARPDLVGPVPLHGLNVDHPGMFMTDFPDGKLLYNPKTFEITFQPIGGKAVVVGPVMGDQPPRVRRR
ncbi:MAG: beta-galactosidase [bacterium]|nr:beta-galactosidase [bacterium]